MMASTMFYVCGALAIAMLIGSLVGCFLIYRRDDKRILNRFQVFTLCVFGTTTVMLLPYYYVAKADAFGGMTAVRPLLASLHHTLRVFILDGDYSELLIGLEGLPRACLIFYSTVAGLLFLLAPLLTFGSVLSMFRNVWDMVRLHITRRRNIYIFSELNEYSLALAHSIQDSDAQPLFVFTDVFTQNEEKDYEQLNEARKLGAVCLKRDIVRVNVKGKPKEVEFFLIGEDESENIAQAIKLIEENQNSNRRIYLYSSKPSAGYVLDTYGKKYFAASQAVKKQILDDPFAFLDNISASLNNMHLDKESLCEGALVRRIDNYESLAVNTLLSDDILPIFKTQDRILSIMILGMGNYGIAFLKAALWLYQVLDYTLEINVFDTNAASGADLLQQLRHQMPEIITHDGTPDPADPTRKVYLYERTDEGDCRYSLRIFPDVDCFSYDFDRLFESADTATRLARTTVAIAALGNDDHNIEAAVMLRALFDRVRKVSDANIDEILKGADLPYIYAVVYDGKKEQNLSAQHADEGLVNSKEKPLHIRFIGCLESQFSYETIRNNTTLEADALLYHMEWARSTHETEEAKIEKTLETLPADQRAAKQAELNANELTRTRDDLGRQLDRYAKYEYFRQSSLARAAHQALLAKLSGDLVYKHVVGHNPDCRCPLCIRVSMAEHARWDAYMRTRGFRYASKTSMRGLQHKDLVVWDDLSEADKNKDRKYHKPQ